jgi:hypothetical protein
MGVTGRVARAFLDHPGPGRAWAAGAPGRRLMLGLTGAPLAVISK